MSRRRGRPKSDTPRECLCVWLLASEREQLKSLANRHKTTISALSRRLLLHAIERISDEDVGLVAGLDTRRTYFGGPSPSRVTRMQCSHETRARRLGIEWAPVDFSVIYDRDRGVCGICSQPVGFDVFTIDHIVPVSKGGPHIEQNLQITPATLRKTTS